MNQIKILIALLFTCFFFSQCTSTNVVSKRAKDFEAHALSDLYYAIYLDKKMEKTLPSFKNQTYELHQKNNFKFEIEGYGFFNNPEAFVYDSLSQKAKKSGFRYLLVMNEKEYEKNVSSTPSFYNSGTNTWSGGGNTKTIEHGLEAFIYDLETDQEIWRAQVEVTSGDYGNSTQTGKSLAKGLIKKLKEDQMLPSSYAIYY